MVFARVSESGLHAIVQDVARVIRPVIVVHARREPAAGRESVQAGAHAHGVVCDRTQAAQRPEPKGPDRIAGMHMLGP